MSEIGIPEKRKVMIPQTVPNEDEPLPSTPDRVPEKVPEKVE